ncbi:MAG: hypothetical protein M4579_003171 [Chaenotheca gracillima]|nr:MAG: hypothetical protein M4579_003171 [Chaenotheca gracillima]
MDAYPEQFLAHNLPLIILSGLDGDHAQSTQDVEGSSYPLIGETGPRINDESPPVATPTAKELLQCFLKADARGAPWNGKTGERGQTPSIGFRIKGTGRHYVLPPRKAFAPPSSPHTSADTTSPSSSQSLVLHSPISPLSPGSPVFPDGVMNPIWLEKHQELVPAVFASFYTLTADPNTDSLHDNQLKNQINNIKKAFTASTYKTRFVVVLLSETSVMQGSEIDERIANIRRATGLDPKNSLFFLPPDTSSVELKAFVSSFLTTLQPVCVEYYRDLSKHSRRKRNRSTIPPPTAPPTSGTSKILAGPGWNVRYEFKLGVFAEFRQEMDAACRNFESAYDALLSQEVFESISSWSPRWNEARTLADVIAIRTVRCLLWNQQTSLAVRKWREHRLRIQDLVDRRGLGSQGYGWAAWEARWAKIMAELIFKTDINALQADDTSRLDEARSLTVYLGPEKSIPLGERIHPWEHIHHPGYWLALSSSHVRARRILAEAIAEEDRAPPGQSPASRVASRANAYDTYMSPEPHVESPLPGHQGTDHLKLAENAIGNEYMHAERWGHALKVLWPLWQNMSWRREGWWALVEDVGLAVRECAMQTNDAMAMVYAQWELTSNITASFGFKGIGSHVGEQLGSQLVVRSNARHDSPPVKFSHIRITFNGSLKDIVLQHSESLASTSAKSDAVEHLVALKETRDPAAVRNSGSYAADSTSFLQGDADLDFSSGDRKTFAFSTIPREAGDAHISSVIFLLENELFTCDYILNLDEEEYVLGTPRAVEDRSNKMSGRNHSSTVKILPKPPKVQLRLSDGKKQFHTDEQASVELEIFNEEEEAVEASLEARVIGHSEDLPPVEWIGSEPRTDPKLEDTERPSTSSSSKSLREFKIGHLESSTTSKRSFTFPTASEPTDYVLEVKILYFLVSDLETPVSKTLTVDLQTIHPFEASYDFSPRFHPDPWPSFFIAQDESVSLDEDTAEAAAQGIAQNWCLTATVESFATESITIESFDLMLLGVNGGVRCITSPNDEDLTLPLDINTHEVQSQRFQLEVRKIALEDRRSSSLDFALDIKWRRSSQSSNQQPSNKTQLLIQRLLIPSGEPRILAIATPSPTNHPVIHLDYALENPSMHLLTFNLSMEASEEFAFSGPKLGSLQLVPLSRHTVRFNIFPLRGKTPRSEETKENERDGSEKIVVMRKQDRHNWIQPQLRVVDRYYNRTLRVTAASEGMEMDKGGILIWVGDR